MPMFQCHNFMMYDDKIINKANLNDKNYIRKVLNFSGADCHGVVLLMSLTLDQITVKSFCPKEHFHLCLFLGCD